MRFKDRADAGSKLAEALKNFKEEDTVVYALPRGGVVLGYEVAKVLGAPLDLAIVRKVGHPTSPEYAVCAVAEEGALICNEDEKKRLDPEWLTQAVESEKEEAKRRRETYLRGRKPLDPKGKIAILVDDGIATGLTFRAAIHELKKKKPKGIVAAIPVSPRDTADTIAREVDEFVALDMPEFYLGAVGAYYDNFEQVSDEEVIELLGRGLPRATSRG